MRYDKALMLCLEYKRYQARLAASALKTESCEVCGDSHTYAHHDNYDTPLVVRWLCAKHHFKGPGTHQITVDAKVLATVATFRQLCRIGRHF